jgi:hypothetical protein
MRSVFLFSCAAGALLWAGAAAATVPASGRLDFSVVRGDSEIGRHSIVFRQTTEGLVVDIQTDVAVKVLFVTAYRFEHQGHEVWRDGQLVQLTSSTNDDGTTHNLDVRANGGGLDVRGDGELSHANAGIVPASLWNEGILEGGTILNTLDGSQMAITVRDAGQDTVMAGGRAVQARHYVLAGDLERELWFDEDGVLVQVRFKGEDGSDISYVLH